MEYYVKQHDGRHPWLVVSLLTGPNKTNSLICHDCYCEITHENFSSELMLQSVIDYSILLFITFILIIASSPALIRFTIWKILIH